MRRRSLENMLRHLYNISQKQKHGTTYQRKYTSVYNNTGILSQTEADDPFTETLSNRT